MTAHPDHHDAYDTWRGRVITAQNETRAVRRELAEMTYQRDEAVRGGAALLYEVQAARATLTRIDALHQPDPDHPTACHCCGTTFPCKTRRELDR